MTETVELLARMARFVVADLSDPRAVGHELATVAPRLARVPIQAVLVEGQQPYAGYLDLVEAYRWVLEPVYYKDTADLIRRLDDEVLRPAERLREKFVPRH
jgi:hypothetical protein